MQELRAAFEQRADGVGAGAAPLIGVFGAGIPLPLLAGQGALALDVKAPPLADAVDGPQVAQVSEVVEPFMDPFAARFLHRLAAGAFDHFALIVFARDDVAALSAYQYANELRRQGKITPDGPRLHLWNLLHSDSAPVRAFNLTEVQRLTAVLDQTPGLRPDPDAARAETRRARALAGLPPGGEASFVARNAGRWLSAGRHADLLAALPAWQPGQGPRIALVGTACDLPVLHGLCAGLGQVVADVQDYGRWPDWPVGADLGDLMTWIARDPLHPRAAPPQRFSRALQGAVRGCDLVIASVEVNDDCFGWEAPGLRSAIEGQGGRFLDLGFRPFRPGRDWAEQARASIERALS